MSFQESSNLSGDRVFQFISDPDHKENLSGRVRAACLTCRRKKIKCSGEINCRTCREKGLVCEGLPERRKPSRDVGDSLILGPTFPGRIERKRKPSKTAPRRPSVISRGDAEKGQESDTIDNAESPTATTATETALPSQSFVEPAYTKRKAAGRPHVDIWRLSQEQINVQPNRPPEDSLRNRVSPDFEISPSAKAHTGQDRIPYSSDPTEGLDEQAQSLRLIENSYDLPDLSRRQTISFPLPTPGSSEVRYDTSHILENQHGVFDDMALLLTSRTPRTGLTPGLTEFSSLWNLDYFDVVSGNDLAPSQSDRPQVSFNDMQSTQPVQELSYIRPTNPSTSYFDSYWPG